MSPGGSIAPPNTYRNSNTKITGWIVEKTSSCGVRNNPMRSRCTTAIASPKPSLKRAAVP